MGTNTRQNQAALAATAATKIRSILVKNSDITRKSCTARRRAWITLSILLSVTACTTPIKQLPDKAELSVPDSWEVNIKQRKPKQADEPSSSVVAEPVTNNWLSSFEDKQLNQYVDRALANNPDLQSSAAQLKAAFEQVTITGSNLWPQVSAGLNRSNTETKTDSVTTTVRNISAALDISWEADIWGRLSEQRKSSLFSAQAQAQLYKSAELSLVANVTRAWYNLLTAKLQLDLAHKRIESFKRTAALVDENYQRGLRSALDVYLSRTDAQVQVSRLADTELNYIQTLRAFRTLLGDYPDSELEFSSLLPKLNNTVPTGMPAELLTRRPDVQASQLLYQAQIANAKAANRARYPNISFSGSIGDSRKKFDQLFENDNLLITLVAGVTQPVFKAGQLASLEKQAVYNAESAYAQLVKTTLTAFEEVENTLSREQSLFEQHTAITQAVEYSTGGLELALERYQSGLEDYNTVLVSQRRLYDSLESELNLRNALLQNRVAIHLALGGDFRSVSDQTQSQVNP